MAHSVKDNSDLCSSIDNTFSACIRNPHYEALITVRNTRACELFLENVVRQMQGGALQGIVKKCSKSANKLTYEVLFYNNSKITIVAYCLAYGSLLGRGRIFHTIVDASGLSSIAPKPFQMLSGFRTPYTYNTHSERNEKDCEEVQQNTALDKFLNEFSIKPE